MPDIPGLKECRGKAVHTANWEEDERLEGRRVGVIGNGATGVQIVPPVASRAKHLTVFNVLQAGSYQETVRLYLGSSKSCISMFR